MFSPRHLVLVRHLVGSQGVKGRNISSCSKWLVIMYVKFNVHSYLHKYLSLHEE